MRERPFLLGELLYRNETEMTNEDLAATDKFKVAARMPQKETIKTYCRR